MNQDKFFELAHFSDVPIVNQYYKSIKAMHHNSEITKGIEEFAAWQQKESTELLETLQNVMKIVNTWDPIWFKKPELETFNQANEIINKALGKQE